MTLISVLTAVALVLTLAYAVLNGMRDASTAVAASVRTRALRPGIAVSVAAFFAFLGTMGTSGLSVALVQELNFNVPEGVLGLKLLICSLLVAGAWGIYCWWRGLPISSTHALLSALVGGSGASALMGDQSVGNAWGLLLSSVILPMLLASVIAYTLSYLLVFPATRLLRHNTSRSVNEGSRAGQAVAAGAVALGLRAPRWPAHRRPLEPGADYWPGDGSGTGDPGHPAFRGVRLEFWGASGRMADYLHAGPPPGEF